MKIILMSIGYFLFFAGIALMYLGHKNWGMFIAIFGFMSASSTILLSIWINEDKNAWLGKLISLGFIYMLYNAYPEIQESPYIDSAYLTYSPLAIALLIYLLNIAKIIKIKS